MNGIAGRQAFQLLERRPDVFQKLAVGGFDFPGRGHDGELCRNTVPDRAKMVFADTQRFRARLPLVLDVNGHSAPFDNLPGWVGYRTGTKKKLSVLSVEAPDTRPHVTRFAGTAKGSPTVEKLSEICRVDRSLPTLAKRKLIADARVLGPAVIEKIDTPIGKRSEDDSRKRVNDTDEFVFHRGPFLRDSYKRM